MHLMPCIVAITRHCPGKLGLISALPQKTPSPRHSVEHGLHFLATDPPVGPLLLGYTASPDTSWRMSTETGGVSNQWNDYRKAFSLMSRMIGWCLP